MTERSAILAAAGAIEVEGVVRRFEGAGGQGGGERSVLAGGAGLVDAAHRDRVGIAGPDAEAFLDRLLTVGVRSMAPGQGGRAFLLDAKGRIQLAFHLYRLGPARFTTDAVAGHGAQIVEKLDLFHFGEQLHFDVGPGAETALELHGPKAAAVAGAMGLRVPEAPGAFTETRIDGVEVRTLRRDRVGGPGFVLVFAPAGYGTVWQVAQDAGARPVGQDALEAGRIAAGVPAWPNELGPHSSPLEMGTMDGITEGKGCYPGQEVIERTLALGRPARALVRLRLDRHAAVGAEVQADDGKLVGTLTSVAPEGDGVIALALLRRRAATAGGPWRVGGATAERVGHETGSTEEGR